MKGKVVSIEQGVARLPGWRLAQSVDFELLEGEHIAIVGENGAGKTLLAEIIAGAHPLFPRKAVEGRPLVKGALQNPQYDFTPSEGRLLSENIKYLRFRDAYGGDHDKAYYLQQRWNQQDISADAPTARAKLEAAFLSSGKDSPRRRARQEDIYEAFGMYSFLDKQVVLLSSGELRKLALAEALFSSPRLLIIDNPFIGLDASARDQLGGLLESLSKEGKLQIILLLSRADRIPPFISHVVQVQDRVVGAKIPGIEFEPDRKSDSTQVLSSEKREAILSMPYSDNDYNCEEVVRMENVSITYGPHILLKDLSWTVRSGEHWALSGPNGSGKSTLLSLVCADNPQSYACNISLFGRRRGSGESIWDIKKHIGYVSPEMHRAYCTDLPAERIVAGGMRDFQGLYTCPSPREILKAEFWMDIFGINGLIGRNFLRLSSGEQRLTLVARAFVKDPQLLVLDEPLHGLDDVRCRMVKDIIETFCQRRNKTLIMVSHYEEELPECIDHRLALKRPE